MTGLAVLLGLVLLAIAVLVALLVRDEAAAEQRRREQLTRHLHHADQQIGREHQQARRAMNDAAGQSWRNLAG